MIDPFDISRFVKNNTCLPCCTVAPIGCMCALLIPPFASPYVDYATALAEIASFTSNCIGYIGPDPSGFTTLTFSAGFSGTTLSLDVSRAWIFPPTGLTDMWASLALDAGAVLTVTWTASGDAGGTPFCTASLYSCDGALIETVSNFTTSAPLVFSSIATDGEYFIKVNGGAAISLFNGSSACHADITCSSAFVVNPVIALWDDSGTTRKLWACPKLLLPPLTESTGTWYASCADANTDLVSAAVSNCVGYCGDTPDTFTATDGGSSLTLNATCDLIVDPRFSMWGGINAVAGETLSAVFSYSGDHGSPTAGFSIYDDTGTLVQSLSGAGGTLTSSALPYTGRYTVRASVGRNDGVATDAFSGTAVITSSGTMSVNPIQARWDDGLTCAGTLDCGDSCP